MQHKNTFHPCTSIIIWGWADLVAWKCHSLSLVDLSLFELEWRQTLCCIVDYHPIKLSLGLKITPSNKCVKYCKLCWVRQLWLTIIISVSFLSEDLPNIYKCLYQGCKAVYRATEGLKVRSKQGWCVLIYCNWKESALWCVFYPCTL